MTTILKTANQKIAVQGKVFYTDNRRRIDLKKPIRDLIGATLKPVEYTMEVCLSKESLLNRVKYLIGEGVMPVIFYFKESGNEMS